MAARSLSERKRTTVIAAVFVLTCMVALTASAVPLYRLFCQVTGFGGTTQVADAAPGASKGIVTVRFNADTGRGMPWEFRPMQNQVSAHLGEQMTVFYEATNPTDRPITGTATFNVTPDKAGPYFAKIACFCFTEQVLEPGQTIAMPVTFFVDPELFTDRETRELRTITLSYTFFEKEGTTETNSAALDSGAAPTTN
ncbi:MAG: cytochrome c oxidase assembly protein [Proteobacteria bacterium]|nr:cytochrome c oxidase assembly protein [Pseudomonadota bacterium]